MIVGVGSIKAFVIFKKYFVINREKKKKKQGKLKIKNKEKITC